MESTTSAHALQTVSNQLDWVELPFYYLGLNTVWKRSLAGAIGTGMLLFYLKPEMLFDSNGDPRAWKLTSSEQDAILVPWWVYCMIVGGVLGTFI